MRFLLRLLFKKYKDVFSDFFVEDLIGGVPKEVNENVLRFLRQGKDRFDEWVRWQSYVIQRRISQPVRNPDIYHGFLLCLRTMQAMIKSYDVSEGIKEKMGEETQSAPKFDLDKSLEAVQEFWSFGKKVEEEKKQ